MKAAIVAVSIGFCSCAHYTLHETTWAGPYTLHTATQFRTLTECEARHKDLVIQDMRELQRNGLGSISVGRVVRFCE